MKEMRIRRLCLLGLWILSLAAISVRGGVISYGFFFGVTLIPVLSLLYILCVYILFKIYQKIDCRSMVCGQPMSYFFVLQNESYFPFASISVRMYSSFSSVEDLPSDTEYELLAKDKCTFETKMTCKYRGEYEVGVKEIVVTDFLRLFRVTYPVSEPIKALVKPRIPKLSSVSSLENLAVYMQRDTTSAETEPDVLVRDYVAGDALKQIHWKLSARDMELKVRKRTGEEKQGIALFFDTKRYSKKMYDYIPLENKILETVLALSNFLVEKNIGYEVCYGQSGVKKVSVNNVREFDTLYEIVSGVMYRKDEEFTETLKDAVKNGITLQNKVLLLVLHELSPELMQMTEQMAETGLLVVLYVVTDEDMTEYLRQSNERRKIVLVPTEADLEGRL